MRRLKIKRGILLRVVGNKLEELGGIKRLLKNRDVSIDWRTGEYKSDEENAKAMDWEYDSSSGEEM